MSERGLPILCLDFDGVVHDYREGWKDGSIYGELTEGFREWAHEARKYFTLVICSSRTNDEQGRAQVVRWLRERDLEWIDVVSTKPPAFLTIDDRAIGFNGSWSHYPPAPLRDFKPWGAQR